MIYIKKSKPKIENLRESYTESAERGYSSKQFNIGYFGFIIIFMGLLLVNSLSAFEPVIPLTQMEDGAGNTWTCSNCRTTNYCWQMSCSNCGNSQ